MRPCKPRRKPPPTASRFDALAFSPNGLFLAIGGDSHLVQTVSADNGAPADTFEGAADAVLSLAYTPSAGLLAGGADKSAILWNTESGLAAGAARSATPMIRRSSSIA